MYRTALAVLVLLAVPRRRMLMWSFAATPLESPTMSL
jgi:hypothetical protein